MPTLRLADLLFVLHWRVTFPGCLHSFLAPSSLTFLLQQEICCNGHFLLPSLGLLHHHFFRCQLLSLFVDHIPVLALASVISGRNNFSSLASSIRAYPHPAHKPSFTVRRLTSTFISHKQAPLLFSPQAWEELLIKKIATLSLFLPALALRKTFFCAGQAQILPLFCLTCCPPGWLKLPCALSCALFLGPVFHIWVESKDCVFMRWAIQWGSQACDNHPWLIVLERAWAEGEEGRGRYIEFLRSSFPSL